MWDEDIIVPLAGMIMIMTISIGIPLVIALARRWDREAKLAPKLSTEIATRLERIEQAVDAMALEVERISEGQRFTTRLLSERQQTRLPASRSADPSENA